MHQNQSQLRPREYTHYPRSFHQYWYRSLYHHYSSKANHEEVSSNFENHECDLKLNFTDLSRICCPRLNFCCGLNSISDALNMKRFFYLPLLDHIYSVCIQFGFIRLLIHCRNTIYSCDHGVDNLDHNYDEFCNLNLN